MKVLSRDFTLGEKLLLLLLSLILVGLAYYQFVDQPVRTALNSARAEADSLNLELKTAQAQLQRLRSMRTELDEIMAYGIDSEMGSYNNSKEEITSLNEILKDTLEYTITFSNVTRTGDQIRRSFTLSFKVDSYDMLERVMSALSNNRHRCLIGDMNCSAAANANLMDGVISASMTATFYETMVGGTPDAGLPESKAAAK